jgi:hypothetical protein
MNFILLPSGTLINSANIFTVYPSGDGVMITGTPDGEDRFHEKMSIEDFQNLLRVPVVTPIVSPIVNLDKLKEGETCSFTYGGSVFHGVIEEISYSDKLGDIFIRVTSDGESYEVWVSDGEVNKV